jgi:hypothetical protein
MRGEFKSRKARNLKQKKPVRTLMNADFEQVDPQSLARIADG